MRLSIAVTLDYAFEEPTDVLLAIEAASMPDQIIISSNLSVTGAEPVQTISGGNDVGNRNWTTTGTGQCVVQYQAVVDLERPAPDLPQLSRCRLPTLPADVIPFIWPSRYCEADRFTSVVRTEFADLDGGALVQAIGEWVSSHLSYEPGCSDATTTAVDTFVARQGVCRDYAHLTAALIRAADIPARLVSVYALDLTPPDFHAVVEVWLDGAWHIVDASRLAPVENMVRIAAGRDATDIAFMTAFGVAELNMQTVDVNRIE